MEVLKEWNEQQNRYSGRNCGCRRSINCRGGDDHISKIFARPANDGAIDGEWSVARDDITGIMNRLAQRSDLPALTAIFAADDIGGHGDTSDPAALHDYRMAFDRIAANPFDTLYVAELGGDVAGTFQTTLGTSLPGSGSSHFTIGAVQTRADMCGKSIGAAMIRYAIQRGRDAGAASIQLMSNNDRIDAHRFYRKLAFMQSHAGFKMKLLD
jgi:GNAT superfamily N-acetyltransferase